MDPESPIFLAAHGATLAEAGHLEQAVTVLGKAVGKRPGDAVSQRNLGQALCALGRVGEAMPHLREAVALVARAGTDVDGEAGELLRFVSIQVLTL